MTTLSIVKTESPRQLADPETVELGAAGGAANIMSGPHNASRSSRATMIDVARDAGVSLKTVSRVINGEAG